MKLYMEFIERELESEKEKRQIGYTERVASDEEYAYGVKIKKITALSKKIKRKFDEEMIDIHDRKLLASVLLSSGVYEKKILGIELSAANSARSIDEVIDFIDTVLPAISSRAVCDTAGNRICKNFDSIRKRDKSSFDDMFMPNLYMMVRSTNLWSLRLALIIAATSYCERDKFKFLEELISTAGKSDDYNVKSAAAILERRMNLVRDAEMKK